MEAGSMPCGAGLGRWLDGECNMPGTPPKITVGSLRPCKIAACARLERRKHLGNDLALLRNPHHDTVTCRFDGNSVTVQFKNSIPAHEETRPVLRGQA